MTALETLHPQPLWSPPSGTVPNLVRFIQYVNTSFNLELQNHEELYEWSTRELEQFWSAVLHFCNITFSSSPRRIVENLTAMPGASWLPGGKLNYAENLLRRRDSKIALVFHGEDKVRRVVSYSELTSQVSAVASWMRKKGIGKGDRVAAVMPNMPETVIAMLATASVGAVFSSCSPDFGTSGIVDRFGQIEPKLLIACDGYYFKGGVIDCRDKVKDASALIPSLEELVFVPYVGIQTEGTRWGELLTEKGSDEFDQLPADSPLFIMYSSGTTGKPKCIVHSVGGTLAEHLKELVLHTDLQPTDTFFYQTTCGWMMWNWLVSGLATGATLVLYDGSPLVNQGKILWDIAEKEGVSIFGTNAKYLSLIQSEGLIPAKSHSLKNLRTILSTGSPLAPESYDYVYRSIKGDVLLSSISGGTDILGCFVLGSPLLPVWRGEIQCRSLGLRVEVFSDKGSSVVGEKGDLVCTAPFPSMPLGFWNDPTGEKFRKAYFDRFPNVWHHGDFCMLTERGGMIIYGRSDATLNPGGIRIGTAEIYNQVEAFPEIQESLVTAQPWKDDERIILYVKLREGVKLSEELQKKIKSAIRANTTPFHVPKKIIEVPDIPRTRSGKITELAIRQLLRGEEVKNLEALANPETLHYFTEAKALREE